MGVLMGLTQSNILRAWQAGDIALGKTAELLKINKSQLRHKISTIQLKLICYCTLVAGHATD